MLLTMLEVITGVAFTTFVFWYAFKTGIKHGAVTACDSVLKDLEHNRIIELVPYNGGQEIYSGFLHRFQNEAIISAALYDFMRMELVKGNTDAVKLYKDILNDEDNHNIFLKKMMEENNADI